MTETVPSAQDESVKDSSQSPSSPKTKSKPLKQANDGNERPKSTEKVDKPPTKVVVRRLPPTMTLETFLDQVAPLPPVDYMYFVKADSSLAPNSFARAYLHFIHMADLLIFTDKFDNYVFVDSRGNEYPAIVEFAPFQRIPKQRSTRKKDPRIGTIENDPYYQEFIEALKAEETQRKSASKTNKQHFFETSTSLAAPKVTSTPLLEFLNARRADKMKTKEDKIAERRKREMERRKAREDLRTTVKHSKGSEADHDLNAGPVPQIKPPQPSSDPTSDLAEIQTRYLRCMIGLDKDTFSLEQIAGHGAASEKSTKELPESKRMSKDSNVRDAVAKRREEERGRGKEKDKERKDREKDSHREFKRDVRRDSMKDPVHDKEKDKENQPATAESKSKETRRGGKSYQEERLRLNERRLAAKSSALKSASGGEGGDRGEKGDDETHEEAGSDKKLGSKKDSEGMYESRSRNQEKFSKNSDHYRTQGSREGRKFEKPNKNSREQDQRRGYEQRRNPEDRHDDHKEVKKIASHDRSEDTNRPHLAKEETRKKSYNQEREQRRAAAADRKNQNRRDSMQGNLVSNSETSLDSKENTSQTGGKQNADKERRTSLDNSKSSDTTQDEPARSKSLADMKALQSPSRDDSVVVKRKENSISRGDEKDKKDPRAERRIRNKDRPSIEIYRPGMGRFSRQRLEREKTLNKGSSTERDSPSPSPSPVPSISKTLVITEKADE